MDEADNRTDARDNRISKASTGKVEVTNRVAVVPMEQVESYLGSILGTDKIVR